MLFPQKTLRYLYTTLLQFCLKIVFYLPSHILFHKAVNQNKTTKSKCGFVAMKSNMLNNFSD